MRLDVVTIFPDYLAPLDLSLIGKARRDGLLDLAVHDLRAFTHDRHRTVDDTPYGGGAGMVMKPEPWAQALDHVAGLGPGRPTLVVPGPGGRPFTQPVAHELAALPWLVFACGRYEGIDERVYEHAARAYDVRVLSLGDYVLNGGEVAVLAMVEAVARLLPGVVGNAASLVEESHEDGLLEYPVYTKPAVWEGRAVPEVLLSGDHARIADWRHRQRLERTAARRPDLLPLSGALNPAGLDAADLTTATPADAGELLTLAHACLGPDHPDLPAGTAEVVASLASWDTSVLRSGGRLVGAVRARAEGSQWQVDGPLVVPDLRGRGLGAWLLGQALARAPRETGHALAVVPDDRAAWPGYRRAGLRPYGTAPAGTTRLSGRLRRG